MFGSSTSDATASSHWPQVNNGTKTGYIRSRNINGTEELGLRNDIAAENGTTTRIGADTESERANVFQLRRTESQGQLKDGKNGWSGTSARTSDEMSEEFETTTRKNDSAWGIRRTVKVQVDHQDIERAA
jgi:hypothetical protein